MLFNQDLSYLYSSSLNNEIFVWNLEFKFKELS